MDLFVSLFVVVGGGGFLFICLFFFLKHINKILCGEVYFSANFITRKL